MKQVNKVINTIILMSLALILCGCQIIEDIAKYNLDNLDQEKTVEEDTTLTLPESTYVKDSIELSMINPITLNPLDSVDYTVEQVLKLIYEPIFVVGDHYELTSGIIADYEKASEKTYTFNLKSNILFHNNAVLTSKDVVYSYNYIKSQPNSTYDYVLDYIESIQALSDTSFSVRFKAIDYFNLYALTFPIISEDYLESEEYDSKVPIGSGAYRFVDLQTMLYMKLTQFDGYYADKPKIPNINISIVRTMTDHYNMFLSKRIDIHSPTKTWWEDYSDDSNIFVSDYCSPYFYYIGINHTLDFFSGKSQRQLLASDIPYELIKEDVFLGHFNLTSLPIETDWHISENLNTYFGRNDQDSYFMDLYKKENAVKYLEEIRKDKDYDLDHNPVIVTVIYDEDDPYQEKIAKCIEDEQSLYQMTCSFKGLDHDSYAQAISSGNYELYIGVYRNGLIPDLASIFKTSGALNYGKYDDMNINGLLSTYRKVLSKEQFSTQLENLSKVISDELPLIPLGYLENGIFLHNQISSGIKPNYFHIYNRITELELVTGS